MVIDSLKDSDLIPILKSNVTAEASYYRNVGNAFAAHGFTHHSAREYVHTEGATI